MSEVILILAGVVGCMVMVFAYFVVTWEIQDRKDQQMRDENRS